MKLSSTARIERYGVEDIPPHWKLSKVKYLANYMNGYPFKPDDWAESGIPIIRIQDLTKSETTPNYYQGSAPSRFKLSDGDILISWSASLGVFVWNGGEAWLNQHIFKVTVDERISLKSYFPWLAEWFIRQLENYVHGSTMQHLTADAFGSFPVIVPPLKEQERLSAYLLSETADIDSLIASKERLLNLLVEKRRAIVVEATMRGINPAAPLRPSGIDWLGDIPAHWELKRSKWLFKERDERSTDGSEVLLSLRMERGLVPHNEVSEKLTRPEELVGYKKTSVGQVVVNRMRAATGLIAITTQDGLVSPDYAVFWPSSSISADYYVEMFKTPVLQAVFRSESTGLGTGSQGFLRLYSQNFLALWFPYPPLEEQHEIVRYIAAETAKIDRLRAATERSIMLLRERRGALIAAAVTGQINIPEAA